MNLTLDIPEKKIAELIAAGFDGWMTAAWCQIVCTKKPRKIRPVVLETEVYPYVDYALLDGGSVTCREINDDETGYKKERLKLNLMSVERGLHVMADKYPHAFAAFLADEGDAITGDIFSSARFSGK